MPVPVPPRALSDIHDWMADYVRKERADHPLPPPGDDALSAPISNILVVGGLICDGSLSYRDHQVVWFAARGLVTVGAEVAPKFNVSVVNLQQSQGGEDFLAPRFNARADVVVAAMIYNREDGCYRFHPAYANSPHHKEPGIWHDKALGTGARVVTVLGDTGGRPDDPIEPGGEVGREFFTMDGKGRFAHVLQGVFTSDNPGGNPVRNSLDMLLRDDFKACLEKRRGAPFPSGTPPRKNPAAARFEF
jgi:hypothetical protein